MAWGAETFSCDVEPAETAPLMDLGHLPISPSGLEVFVRPDPNETDFYVYVSDRDAGRGFDDFEGFVGIRGGGQYVTDAGLIQDIGARGSGIVEIRVSSHVPEGVALIIPKRLIGPEGVLAVSSQVEEARASRKFFRK